MSDTPITNAKAMRELASLYHGYGINVLPLGADKRPVLIVGKSGSPYRLPWEAWQTTRQTGRALTDMRKPSWWEDVHGIAAILGPVSGNLACLDIDAKRKHDPSLPAIPRAAAEYVLSLLGLPRDYPWLVRTPGLPDDYAGEPQEQGGWAIYVSCPGLVLPENKGKLDRPPSPDLGDAVGHIELRWSTHYCVLPGSTHPSGGKYKFAGERPAKAPAEVYADALLAAYDAITVEEPAEDAPIAKAPTVTRPSSNGGRASAYAEAALAGELAKVRSTRKGDRNNQIFRSAAALGEFIAAQALEQSRVERELTFAAQDMAEPLPSSDIESAVRSGINKGMAKPREIPEGDITENVTYDGFGADTPDTLDTWEEQGAEEGAEDAPQGKHVAWPYAVKRGRLVYQWKDQEGKADSKPIADFACGIVEEAQDEDGTKVYIIEGTAIRRGAFRCEIDAQSFEEPRKLKAVLGAAAGALDAVYAKMDAHLTPAIKKLTDFEKLHRTRRYTRTGWLSERERVFLLPGRSLPNGISVSLERKLPYAAHAGTGVVTGLQALCDLLDAVEPTVSAPVLSMLFQAPAHRLLGWQNERYGVFIQGRTGSLKTSWTQTAMTIYGPRFSHDDLLIKWGEGATRNAIMAMATSAHDMPFLIDNYKPNTGGGANDFVNLLHNILEGGEKDRLTRASTLRPSKPVHCFPLITGEDVPDSDPASLARVLVVQFDWQRGQVNDALSRAQADSARLAAVGSAWLDWLESDAAQPHIAEIAGLLPQCRARWAAHLRTVRPDMVNILRVATNLATNELTWQLALRCPAINQALTLYTNAHRDGLFAIADSMAVRTAESLEAKQFLNALRELVVTRQYIIAARGQDAPDYERDRVLGWADSDGIYLLPELTRNAVKKLLGPGSLPLSNQALYSQLDGLGLLAIRGAQQATRLVKVGGKAQRVLHLRIDALSEAEASQGQEADELLAELGL